MIDVARRGKERGNAVESKGTSTEQGDMHCWNACVVVSGCVVVWGMQDKFQTLSLMLISVCRTLVNPCHLTRTNSIRRPSN